MRTFRLNSHPILAIQEQKLRLSPKLSAWRGDSAIIIAQLVWDIFCEPERAVQIDQIGFLAEQDCRRHADRSRHHATDHRAHAAAFGLFHDAQAFGEASCFVELDIDGIIFFGEGLNVAACVHALIGADRDMARPAGEGIVLTGWKRLLNQRARRSRPRSTRWGTRRTLAGGRWRRVAPTR